MQDRIRLELNFLALISSVLYHIIYESHSYIMILFNNLYQNAKEPLIVLDYTPPGISVYKRFFPRYKNVIIFSLFMKVNLNYYPLDANNWFTAARKSSKPCLVSANS